MPNPAIQDIASLIQIIGTLAIVTFAVKLTRFISKRESALDIKLEAIHAAIDRNQSAYLERVKDDVHGVQTAVDRAAETAAKNQTELLKELRDERIATTTSIQTVGVSSTMAIQAMGDKIVNTLIQLKN